MKRLNLKLIVDPVFTAEDWQLFTCSMDCSAAANSLNKALKEAINSGVDRRTTRSLVHREMNNLSKFGAADSEPLWFLEQILDSVYGSQDDWK